MKALKDIKLGSKAGVTLVVGALVLGGGGVGYAAVKTTSVHVCAAAKTGNLRAAGKCGSTEKAYTLAVGARGATGKTGLTGAPGAAGAPGAPGAAGAPGTAKAYTAVVVDAQGNPTLSSGVGFTDITKPGGVNSNIYCLYVAAGVPLTEPLVLTSLVYAQGNTNVAGFDAQASAQQCHGAYQVNTYDLNGGPADTAGFNVLVP